MDELKNIIIDYYNKLVNDVDITTEKYLRNNGNIPKDEINSFRNCILSCIKNAQEFNLVHLDENKNQINSKENKNNQKHILFKDKFCFFIQKDEDNQHLIEEKVPGVLICASIYVPKTCVFQINEILKNRISIEDVKEKNLAYFLITYTICKLIEKLENPSSIIDLTDSKKNVIEELILKGNFKQPSEDSFNHLDNLISIENVTKLEFGFFDLDSFSNKWFQKFSSLQELAIFGNSVKKLYTRNFSYLKSLKTFEITTSNLEIVESNVFDGLDSLENLIYRTQQINNLNVSNIKQLKNLTIQFSELKFLTKDTIIYNDKIEKLKIQNNSLVAIEDESFVNGPDLKELVIKNNSPKLKIRKNAFSNLNELEVLGLNENGMLEIQSGIFDHLNRLKYLNLYKNDFKTINSQIFNRLENLKILNLNKNKDLKFDFNSINLPNLKYLEFNSNFVPRLNNLLNLIGLEIWDLKDIEESVFSYENNLQYVCLKFNYGEIYDQLNGAHFNGLKNLEYLEVRIKNLQDFDMDKATEKDKQLKDIINPKTKNSNCEIDYFLSSCLIKTNVGSKREFLENIFISDGLNCTDLIEDMF